MLTSAGYGPGRFLSRYSVALAGAVSLSLAIAPVFAVGALGGQVRSDLGLNRSQLGLLVSALMVVAMCAAPTAGRAVDRLGEHQVRRLGLAATTVCHAGIGVTGTDGLRVAASMGIGGLGLALVDAATNAAVAHKVPQKHQAMSFGLKEAGAPLAALFGGVAASVAAEGHHWRIAFATLAVATLLWGIFDLRSHGDRRPSPPSSRLSVANTPLRQAALLAVGLGIGIGCATCLTTYVVEYSATTELGVRGAGHLLAAASVGVIVVRLAAAYAVSRSERAAPTIVCCLVLMGAAGHLLLPLGSSAAMTTGVVLGLTFGYGWGAPVFLLLTRRYPAGLGRAAGLVFMGGYAGAVLGIPLFGFVADRSGFDIAWLCSGGAALVAAAAIAAGLASDPRDRDAAPLAMR